MKADGAYQKINPEYDQSAEAGAGNANGGTNNTRSAKEPSKDATKTDNTKDAKAKSEGKDEPKKTFIEQLGFKAPDLKVQMIN